MTVLSTYNNNNIPSEIQQVGSGRVECTHTLPLSCGGREVVSVSSHLTVQKKKKKNRLIVSASSPYINSILSIDDSVS